MLRTIFKHKKYKLETSPGNLETVKVDQINLEIAQKLRAKIDKLNDSDSADYLSVLDSNPNLKKELDDKKARGVAINYSSYIEQFKSQLEANLTNIEIKHPEIKRHSELTSQNTEIQDKIKSIETILSSTESAFNPDGSINAMFIKQYRKSKLALQNINEPIKDGKRINLEIPLRSAVRCTLGSTVVGF